MRRSLFFIPLVFGSLVLNGCGGRGIQIFSDTTPTPTEEAVAFATPTAAAAIATPTPAVIVVTATPPPVTPPTETPDKKVGGPGRNPTPTSAVDLPPPPTPTPTIPGLWLFDDFENPDNDGSFDKGLWHLADAPTTIEQNNGVLTLSRQSLGWGGVNGGNLKIEEISFVEAKVKLESIAASNGGIGIILSTNDWAWATNCFVSSGQQMSDVWASCWTPDGFEVNRVKTQYNVWHTVRFEVNPATGVFSYLIDGQPIGTYTLPDSEAFKQTQVHVVLHVGTDDGGLVTGYIDDVRVGKAQAGVSEVDPALYDDFNDEKYVGTFDPKKWATTVEQSSGQIEQQEGKLILSFIPGTDITSIGIGTDEAFGLNELGFMEAEIYLSNETAKEGDGEISSGLYTPLNNSQDLVFSCSIYKSGPSAEVGCEVWVFDKSNSNSTYQPEYVSEKKPTSFDTPHIVRIEVDPEANVTFYIDNQPVGSHKPNRAAEVKDKDSKPTLWIVRNNQSGLTAYVDDVRIGRLGQ